MISENKAYTLSIFLTILMVFCTYISGYANENSDPVFIDGARAIRSIAENTPAGVNIGAPVAATDADGDTLTYSKGWLDGMAFTVDSATGQIQTKAALDYETQKLYSFAIFADDGNGGKTVTSVTINVTDVDETPANRAPVFTDGTSATRSIAENTASGTNIGTAIAATDADNDTLTYTLEGTDASSFSIVSTSGQLQTKAALDYEAKSSYSVRITVSDSELTDTIDVTINVSDVDENRAPSFAEGTSTTRSIAENTAADTNIGSAVAATDPDDDTLTYTLGGADAAAFSINNTTGQLQTRAALDYEAKSSYSVRITVSDSKLTDTIDVTINVTDVDENRAPSFTEGNRATRSVAENTGSGQDIGSAVSATDPDDDTLTYTLGGTDASSFRINSTTGQLRTRAALDYETKSSYSVRITVSDSKLTDTIDVTINVTDVDENRAPSFTEGNRATRSVAENTGSGQDIGSAVGATDPDTDDTLTYTLGGTDASSFSIVSTSGQLQTSAALNYESKSSYSVSVSVSDGNGGSDSIDVTINVTNVNEAPSFANSTATRSIAENTAANTNIGTAISATDPDTGDTLTYTLGGADAAAFRINSTNGRLKTRAALDYETKTSYSVRITVSDSELTDTIDVTVNVTDVDENRAPSFADGASTTRSVAENTAANTNIGSAVAATDPDDDTLTYTLGGTDAAMFRINSTNGQLKTRAALDYETKTSYSVRITVSDSELTDTIDVTVNVTDVDENRAPSFTDGSTTTRSIAENTAANTNIGSAVAATDPDDDTLTYTLGGTDAAAFSIVSTSGQLRTNAALNYESDASYSVRVSVSDGNGESDSIDVTISVTDVNESPIFASSTATRSIAENTGSGEDIGSAVGATDPDAGDTLTYTLGGTDAASFSIVSTSGQLQTRAALDYETKTAYSVRITVSDSELTDTIDVTINVTDVDENRAPSFADGTSTTRSIAENTGPGQDIGSAVAATDPDDDTLTYILGGTDAAMFSIVSTSGQLQTKAALDYEAKSSYSVRITVSDAKLTDTIDVRINVTDVSENRAPAFTAGASTTRSVAENTAADTNIGSAISATDPDDDTLTYTLGGTDAASFSIVSTSGQLQTNAALNYESKSSYSVTVDVSDGNGGSDSIPVTISVTDVNEAPSFANSTATRSIAENTGSGENIGAAITATDVDANTTLAYTLGGADAAAFSIVSTSGQLQTNAALDYETKTTYSVTVTATDGDNLSDTTTVAISVTDVNEAPIFASSTAIRSIAENTGSGEDIGSAVTATDPDTGDTLTYSLSGTDASSFSIVSTSGQLQTNAALDYETKTSYSVRITASDSELTDSIDVTINVTDVDENSAPTFTAGSSTTRSITENTNSGVNIGSPIAATDADTSNTLTYTLGGTDAAMFGIVSTSGQLQTKAALNYESKSSYSVKVDVSDGNGGSDSIPVTISVTDVNESPNFASSTATRSIAENTASGENIGSAVGATDPDTGDTLTYTLGGADAAAFSIVSTSGQLQTNVALDYETKSSYSVTVTATDDDTLSDTTTVTISVTDVNEAPNFATNTATRSVAENTAADTNIGAAITATDVDANTTLTYTLGGTDAASFSIVSTSGQLQTSAALDYETKTSYSVRITVSDSELTDTIDVTINVTDVDENRAPAFAEGTSTTRSVAENTAADTNIGSAVAATDPDDDTLTYTVGGADAASFSIVSTSGQLQTNAALDYETKTSYSVTVSVSDGNGGSDSIPVTISVTDVNEAPSFANSTATRSVAENTAADTNIGAAITATDVDANTTLTYTLGGTDADSFSIVSTSGQLQTRAALDYETKSSYSVIVAVSDGNGGSDSIVVTINVTDVDENRAPSFTEGTSTTRSIAENTAADTNIGSAVSATDPDEDTLTYTLGGTDAAMFSIVSTSGQLQTSGALDYETKTSYSVRITASDSELTDTIDVTINVTDVDENRAPSFADGASTTRSVAENTEADTNIGSAVSATDPDADDTLTYSLSGADAAAFSIDSTNGQLQTSAALDYETKTSYSVTITVSDSELTDTIDVTISVTNVNEAPNFATTTATRSIAENTAANTNIGTAVTATDVDANTTLAYTLGGADASSFSIVSTSGQLQTSAALDHETKATYTVIVTATDGGNLSDTISVTISVTDVNDAPNFATDTAIRSVAENTAADTNIGTAVAATDPDTGDTLTYTLGGADAASFTINSTNGQLQTSGALDYETKTSYAVTITVSDSELTDTIDVTISVTDVNEAPNFANSTATRSIAENTAADTNIGAAITATDVDANTTLAYTLGGADASSFSIVSTSGQLQTSAALDHETKATYTVIVTATDGGNLSDTISVTISVTDVNDAPNFATDTAIRSVAENTAADTNIGTAVAATDPDTGDTLTYTLGGTDAASFSIVSTSGQLRTSTALDYETKTSYSVRITVSDTELTDTIDVTINVTNVNEAPSFTAGSTATRTIAENTASGTNIGAAVTATDVDANTTLTYTLGGTDAATFSIVSTSGQLQTSAALNYETKTSYSVKISVADGSGGTDTIDVTINVTDVYEPIIHRTQQVQDAIVAAVPGVNHADYVTVAHLAAITSLDLSAESITSLKSGDFNELPALTHLNLSGNSISNISVLSGLTALTRLDLSNNSISNISALTDLTGLTGLDLSGNSISNISALEGLTGLTTLDLSFNSISDISKLEGLTKLTYLYLLGNPISDYGPLRRLWAAIDGIEGHPGLTLDINIPPVFTEGTGTTRSVPENTPSGQDIGDPVSATDADNYVLDYSLEGADADSFSIDGSTGQLQTSAALDYETKSSYSVTVSVSDGNGGTDTIAVTINVTDVNFPPSFTDGDTTARSVAENTPSGQDIGTAVAATDADNDTLTYSLGGADAASFSIVSTSGQLRTRAALNYRTKSSYSVTVSVADGKGGTDSITVTINVTNVPVNRRTQQVEDAIVAAVPDADNADEVTSAHLAAITRLEIRYAGITSLKSSDFSGLTGLTGLDLSGNSISNISALSGLTKLTYLSLANNSISNVSALERLTALTYLYLSGNPISDYDPLRRLLAAIAGIEEHPGLTLDINIPPVFTEGTRTTRSVAEYTPSGQDIGDPVSATDANKDSLTYSLEGTDADAFNIDSATGQLQTNAALRYQTKRSYSVTVSVDDGYEGGTDTIAVTINVTDVNEASITPVNKRTQQVQDAILAEVPEADNADEVTVAHLAAITDLDLAYENIASLKSGDFSGLPSLTELVLSGNSISNISVLSGLTKLTYLDLSWNSISNIWTLSGLTKLTYLDLSGNSITSVSVLERLTTLTDLKLSDNPISNYDPLRRLLTAIAGIEGHQGLRLDINIPPVFTEGTRTTRSVAEYTPPSQDIGDPVSATDADGEYLSYSLEGTDADSFSIHGSTGQLQTSAALHYQTKRSYSVTVSVDDGYEGGTDTIAVTIYVTNVNEALITPVNQRTQEVQDAIVDKVSGVDNADDVTPAHLAAITDFSLRSEGITSLKSSDFSGLSNLANLDLSDNSISNISVLSGLTKLTTLYLERNAISNVSALERLTKLTNLYLESNPISDYAPLRRLKKANPNIYISINIDNNPPQFTQGTNTTRYIPEDAISYTDIGEPISATDTDPYDTLTYRFAPEPFGTSDAEIFGIDPTSGQLYTYAELDYEEQTFHKVVVDVSDGNGGMDRITVTIYVRDVAGAAPSLETSTLIPNQTGLLTNFPNPFNPETWIPYQLAKPAEVTLTIYDIRGVVVRELKLGHQPAGFYHNRSRAIHWDGRNAFGEKVATGVYFYTLKAGNFTATRKLLIRK